MSIRNAGLTPRQITKRGQIESERVQREATKTTVDRAIMNSEVGRRRDAIIAEMKGERLAQERGGSGVVTFDNGGHMSTSEQDPALKRIEEIQRTRNVSYTQAAMIFSNEYPQEAADYRQRVLTQAEATTRTTDSRTAGTGSAIVKFDALVDAKRAANPKAGYAAAILAAATENPTLAAERNAEISIRIGPGGVAMTNV